MNAPLISCICVTRNRPELLQTALHCFDMQTYTPRELVLVLEEGDERSCTLVQHWNRDGDKALKIVNVAPGPDNRLGQLRNLGIAAAEGAYFCQWDDDDWYHPERLQVQYAQLAGSAGERLACVLDQWLIYDAVHQQAYRSCIRHWEGSILCDRNFALQHQYQNLEKGEDSPLVNLLLRAGQLQTISNHAHLYIYTFHGANTWDFNHFNGFMRYSQLLPQAQQEAIIQIRKAAAPPQAALLQQLS